MTENQDQFDGLPVRQIWREAYGFVFSVPGRVIATALVPFGIYFLISLGVQLTVFNETVMNLYGAISQFEELSTEDPDAAFTAMVPLVGSAISMFFWVAILGILGGLAGAMMASAWHRTTLIGLDADRTGFGFFFGRSELSYFGRALLMFLITFAALFAYAIVATIVYAIVVALIAVPATVVAGGVDVIALVLMIPLVLGGVLVWLYLWSKMIMSLPAAALGIKGFGLAQSWSATRGHVGRLMITYAGLMLPPFLLGMGIGWAIELAMPTPTDLSQITDAMLTRSTLVAMVPNFVITVFSTALVASGMSYTYYRLGQPPEWVEKVF